MKLLWEAAGNAQMSWDCCSTPVLGSGEDVLWAWRNCPTHPSPAGTSGMGSVYPVLPTRRSKTPPCLRRKQGLSGVKELAQDFRLRVSDQLGPETLPANAGALNPPPSPAPVCRLRAHE